ncbi:Methylmalonyl-CoA epimerase [Acidisarcina polymorpha]|uniref:Methylmalonyl-CoA epimerase n=1 Tax=Acidisarcina polymorpha TaxID=2211140 RepID=A0A2Z5FVC5_9BACT|nr:DUF4174 domain-containing protein [Acidisarcina polymorpha]AXC10457.1 Methylmalonyl-CoA epimerase [Acidisarcina polymorpha]
MRISSALLAFAAFALAPRAVAQADLSCPVQPATLKAMRDCYRPVLVFAPNAKDASFATQQKLLEQYADDMMDRNLLYIPVLIKQTGFEKPLDAPFVLLKETEINAIRSRFRVDASDFAVVLVGKDGGEKYRSRKPVSVLKLDDLVDAMPMGGQEKRARSASHKE